MLIKFRQSHISQDFGTAMWVGVGLSVLVSCVLNAATAWDNKLDMNNAYDEVLIRIVSAIPVHPYVTLHVGHSTGS